MKSPINLLHLKFFCDCVVYKSISESAKMNFVTQSAVSQAISKLEKIFGVQLVVHNRQKLYVTEEGKIVYEQALGIFKAVQQTFDKVHQTKEEVKGTLKFVTTKSLGMSFLADTYQKVTKELPHVNLQFIMGGLNLIRTALRREEAEFAIVVDDHNFNQFAKQPIKKGRVHLYQNKNSSPDLIEQGVFVDYYGGMYVDELQDLLNDLDPPLKIKAEIAGWELVARFAELGLGVGFFPDYIVSNNRYSDLEIHPLKTPPFEYEICAIYNKASQLSRTAQAFLDKITLG